MSRKIAVVVTRDPADSSGRHTILARMRLALRDHQSEIFRLPNLVEVGSMREIAAALLLWLGDALRGRFMPLQCLLYASPAACRQLTEQLAEGGFNVIFLDTVRCQLLLRHLRRHLPHARIVTDFDDLMSRRMTSLRSLGLPFLTGHAGEAFPPRLRRLLEGQLSGLITRYEAFSLRGAERDAVRACDCVVLTSPAERDMLAARLPACAPRLRAVPPPVALRADVMEESAPIRFVFIGSDRQLQNRLVIDRLLALWRKLAPHTPLHIYGRQLRQLPSIERVFWYGFVPDLAQVYQPGSVLLYPGVLRGGIKTKIAEAWSFGCPVLGNAVAFEGLSLPAYPLNLPEPAWEDLLLKPQDHRKLWVKAARQGQEFVALVLTPDRFDAAWCAVMAVQAPALSPHAAAEPLRHQEIAVPPLGMPAE